MRHSKTALFYLSLLTVMLVFCTTTNLEAKIFNVQDYGAIGDGVTDDSSAIAKAIEAAKAQPDSEHVVLLPTGTYRLATTHSATFNRVMVDENGVPKDLTQTGHLLVASAQNLTIRGESGTKLIMTDVYTTGVLVVDSTNVTLEQVSIDFDPLPFTQGLVESVDLENKLVTVQIQQGYADLSREDFHKQLQARRMMIFDPVTRQLDHEVVAKYRLDNLTPLGDRRWQMKVTSNPIDDLKAGHHLFAIIARRARGAVMFKNSTACTALNVTVHSAPSCGFILRDSNAIKILHCTIATPAGSDRLMSTNADGVHCKYNKVGPEIAYCRFTGMDDDSVNIGGSFARVLDQKDSTTLVVHVQIFEPGDRLVLVNGDTGEYMQQVTVKSSYISAFNEQTNAVTLKLNEPVGKLKTQLEIGPPFKAIAPIRLPVEERIVPTLVLNLDRCGKNAYVHHNVFENHRVRGVLMRAPDARIEHNTFRNLNGPAIFAGHEFGFLEGPAVLNLTIANNLFENIRLSNIFICNTAMDRTPSKGMANRNVVIRDNVFMNYGAKAGPGLGINGVAIDVSNTKGVSITGNRFGKPTSERDPALPLIHLGLSEQVQIKDNLLAEALILK
ncbi:MAG TPA: hypothetical protein DER01_20085 [Phycisphaerales bacterium]|nr:hypothetical protein [Phycisphaerales bacterium]